MMDYNKAIESLRLKFKSGNDVPVQEARITRGEFEAILTPGLNMVNREELYRYLLEWRDIETPCKTCGGCGRRGYGNTATWSHGIGGQQITGDVCDVCWGTGDANRKGADLRKLRAELQAAPAPALRQAAVEIDAAVEEQEALVAGEVLAGNIVKENFHRGVLLGLRIAKAALGGKEKP